MSNNDLNTSKISKKVNTSKILSEGGVPVKKIRNSMGLFLIFIVILLTLYYIYNIINKLSFSFKGMEDEFKQSIFYDSHLIKDDYGLKGNDYIDFLFNIRTGDGISDCKINGRTTKRGLKYVDVKGSSNICQDLKY